MLVEEAIKRLEKVDDRSTFHNLFFDEFAPMYEIVYRISEGNYSTHLADRQFNSVGSCSNSYMKLEDGYVPYPF